MGGGIDSKNPSSTRNYWNLMQKTTRKNEVEHLVIEYYGMVTSGMKNNDKQINTTGRLPSIILYYRYFLLHKTEFML